MHRTKSTNYTQVLHKPSTSTSIIFDQLNSASLDHLERQASFAYYFPHNNIEIVLNQ